MAQFWERTVEPGSTSATLAGGFLLDYPSSGLAQLAPLAGKNETLSPKAWRQLGLQLQGSLIRPGDMGFPNLALPNNLRYRSITPGGIALCADAADIATSLKWAKRHGIPLITRGGWSFLCRLFLHGRPDD